MAEEADLAMLLEPAGPVDENEAFGGVVGLGHPVAEGRRNLVPVLRGAAVRLRSGLASSVARGGR